MTSAPLRVDETASLQALLDLEILDSEPEPEFDALVHAAALACDAPMALVSLVDQDRQWFKARVNFDGPAQTARELSFCAHAVLADDLFVIEDTALDARFAKHPAVVGDPHIRFYAGAPLRLASGQRVGTLCVMDRTGRTLSQSQRLSLARLATAVVRALEGRQAVRRLRANQAVRADTNGAQALIDHALSDVQGAMAQMLRAQGVAQPPRGEAAMVERLPRSAPRASSPAQDAMLFCLTSSLSLLGITRRLLQPAREMTPIERAHAWTELAEETKMAGRSAYRAGLVLADPHAGPASAAAPAVSSTAQTLLR